MINPSYGSWKPDPGAAFIDAFSITWRKQFHLLVDVPGVLPRQQTSLMDGLHIVISNRQSDPVFATVPQVLDFLVEIFESGIGYSDIK